MVSKNMTILKIKTDYRGALALYRRFYHHVYTGSHLTAHNVGSMVETMEQMQQTIDNLKEKLEYNKGRI